jgi:hypothetical protein
MRISWKLVNYDTQDIIVLNLQRACETSFNMAMHLVRINTMERLQTTLNSRDDIAPSFLFLFCGQARKGNHKQRDCDIVILL